MTERFMVFLPKVIKILKLKCQNIQLYEISELKLETQSVNKMDITKKIATITLLLVSCVSTIHAQQPYEMPPASTEKVIGTVSGEQDAGESRDIYYYKESFIKELSKWVYDSSKDRRRTYSKSELYDKCMSEAQKKYGNSYPNLYLRNFKYSSSEENLPDEEHWSQVVGTADLYKWTNRRKREYRYSATVVVSN